LSTYDFIIIGAGIAGLTTAIALEKFGFSSLILEKASELKPVGAGIQLTPNATYLLSQLNILDALLPQANLIDCIDLLSAKTCDTLMSLKTKSVSSKTAPFLSLHRADLQIILLAKVQQSSLITLRLGTKLVNTQTTPHNVHINYLSNDHQHTAKATCLIGADGVHSQFHTPQNKARFSGYIAYRHRFDAANMPHYDKTVRAYLAPNAHMVTYPLKNKTQTNVVLISKKPLKEAISSFHQTLKAPLMAVEDWTDWPLYTLSPSAPWRIDERTILIGDAAHAMLPFAAQGAAMAIEDAYCLAKMFHNHPQPHVALNQFEVLRRKRIQRVMARSRFNGFAYHAHTLAFLRNLIFKAQNQRLMDHLKWLYEYRI
jgi:salicylate hydroxylase